MEMIYLCNHIFDSQSLSVYMYFFAVLMCHMSCTILAINVPHPYAIMLKDSVKEYVAQSISLLKGDDLQWLDKVNLANQVLLSVGFLFPPVFVCYFSVLVGVTFFNQIMFCARMIIFLCSSFNKYMILFFVVHQVDIPVKYLGFFLEDDAELEHIRTVR